MDGEVMELFKPPTFGEFRRLIEPIVVEHEAEHGLIYGISGISAPPADAYCAVVLDGNGVVAAGVRTVAKMVVSREGALGAVALLADDALRDPGFRGALGPPESVRV